MLREPLSKDDAKRLAARILESGEVRFSSHALREMRNDLITEDFALIVLRSGYVEFSEHIGGSWRYRFRAQGVVGRRVSLRDSPGGRDGLEGQEMRRLRGRRCLECGSQMTATSGDWKGYALPGVVLQDIPIHVCRACGEEERAIQKPNQLARVIASALVEKPGRLTATEIRYLRNHIGLASAEMAKHMGTTPETVSRWENGATPMGTVSDRLLRALVALKEPRRYPLETFRRMAGAGAKPLTLALRYAPRKGWIQEPKRHAA